MPPHRIYLSPPHMGGAEQKYVKDAFDSNWVAPLGANVNFFEQSLSEYCGSGHVAVLSSGTAAIHLALILCGVGPGDEVIASSFTFSATINPVKYLGAKPILIDSERSTWNMDPDLLNTAIINRISKGIKPKAIIPVHLYGMPARMDEIMEIANHYEIPVIEDAAEALGSKYRGKQVGTMGKMGILSFNGNKIITTSGGGALMSHDAEIIEKAKFLATQARDKAPHYQHSQIGYNYRMSNVLAGIGRGQMEVLSQRVNERRENFNYYKAALKDIDGISFLNEPNAAFFSNHWLTTILMDPEKCSITRQHIENLFANADIECRPLWQPMHKQPVFAGCLSFENGTSEYLFRNGLCLPSGSNLTPEDRERISAILKQCMAFIS